MLDDLKLEELERGYFVFILTYLKQDLEKVIEGLNSRIKIISDWYEAFQRTARKGYKSSDLETGAERIFHHFFAPILKFPNSSPIGSDLFFEMPECYLHIEVKTAIIGNEADYKGKVNIGINQTSYGIERTFLPNLPQYYERKKKPCLTYCILIIHEHAKPNIKALLLISIPPGQLFPIYGKGIFRSGKGGVKKARDFRYKYAAEP